MPYFIVNFQDFLKMWTTAEWMYIECKTLMARSPSVWYASVIVLMRPRFIVDSSERTLTFILLLEVFLFVKFTGIGIHSLMRSAWWFVVVFSRTLTNKSQLILLGSSFCYIYLNILSNQGFNSSILRFVIQFSFTRLCLILSTWHSTITWKKFLPWNQI